MGAPEPLHHGSPGASVPVGAPEPLRHGSPGASAPVGALEPRPMGALEPLYPWEPWSL